MNWEYQITRYKVENTGTGFEGVAGKTILCDSKGACFLHDTSKVAEDMIRDAFNEEGKSGWELVQFGYHVGELLCVWKRKME